MVMKYLSEKCAFKTVLSLIDIYIRYHVPHPIPFPWNITGRYINHSIQFYPKCYFLYVFLKHLFIFYILSFLKIIE